MENKKLIINNIFNSLREGGYFLMGSGESLIGMKVDNIPVKVEESHFYQKPAKDLKKTA